MSDDDKGKDVAEVAAEIAASVPTPKEDKATASDLIDNATIAAERLEKANAELKGLIAKQEKLAVERTLGGVTEAGSFPKSIEQKEIDSARALLKGTGYEEELFPDD